MKKKYITTLIFISINIASYSQTFYDMLKVCIDSSYSDILRNTCLLYNNSYNQQLYDKETLSSVEYNKLKRNISFGIDGRYFPYGFKYEARNISLTRKRKLDESKNKFICNYSTYIGNDTIVLFTHYYEKETYYDFNRTRKLFWSSANYKIPVLNDGPVAIFVWNKNSGTWIYSNDSINLKQRDIQSIIHDKTSVQSFISKTLEMCISEFVNNHLCSINRMVVLDNSFGYKFFIKEYTDKVFPLLVTSECYISKEELKNKHEYLFGWTSIELNNDTISTEVRCLNATEYNPEDKKTVDEATKFKCKLSFCYSYKTKKWECVRKRLIDYCFEKDIKIKIEDEWI